MRNLEFFKPSTLVEAKNYLSKHNNSKLLAGGTDLVLDLNKGNENPEHIIDISSLTELKNIYEDEEKITIGSAVSFTQIKESDYIKNNFNALIACASTMGSPQIRNVATIGGNIANAGSAADIVPCILCLDGVLVIESINGTRQISCENYFKNYSVEKIKTDEILTQIIIPKKNNRNSYYKLGKRNSLAISRVSVALSVKLNGDIIENMSICLGAVGRFPFRAKNLEKIAQNKNINWLFSEEPLSILENEVFESIKGRKTMPFKKEAIKGVYKEALKSVINI
jgi:CO/xanthine dehydrogenase FAD-binding subunit